MIYVTSCPKCRECVSFLDNEETKICRCGEVIINIKKPEITKIKKVKKK